MKNIKLFLLVFVIFVLSRFPDLGHDTFNTDVWKWKQRSYDFGSGVFTGQFEKTIQKYHPGVTLMWVGSIGVKVYNLYYNLQFGSDPIDNNIATVFGLHFVQKFLLVCVIGMALGLIFLLLRGFVGTWQALFVTAFVAFEPFYVALTRVFHLEGLMTTLMILSMLLLYSFFQTKNNKTLILSGVVAGLALLTKTSSLYLMPFTGLTLFVFTKDHSVKTLFKRMFIWVLSAVVAFVILWPIMWVNPVHAISELYRGVSEIGVENEHIQLYFGKLVSDPGPLYYLVVLGFRSSPWLLIGLIGMANIYRKQEVTNKKFILYLFLFGLFYLIQSSIPSKKLDRYILPTLGSWGMIAALFYLQIQDKIKVHKFIKIGVFPLIFIAQLICLHPEYLSYYNPMFGGLRVGINVLEPKWMIGIKQVNQYFSEVRIKENLIEAPTDQSYEELIGNKTVEKVLAVSFPEKYYTQIWPFFRENKSWAVINDLGPLAKYSGYFVYPVWDDGSVNEDRFKIERYGQIQLRGVTLYNVYKRVE